MIALLILAGICYWVYKDAKERGSEHALLWAIGVFLLLIVVLPMYFLMRPPKKAPEEEIQPSFHANTTTDYQSTPVVQPEQQPMLSSSAANEFAHSPELQNTAFSPPAAQTPAPQVENYTSEPMHANAPQADSVLCINCGQYIDRTIKFCPYCGTPNKQ